MALLNETTVSIRTKGGEWEALLACYELPDFGVDPENVDTTTLNDTIMTNELGLGDPGSIQFQFRYRPGADQAYAILEGLAEEKELEIQVEYKVGLKVEFPINGFTTKLLGGGVNGVMDFTLSVGLAGPFVITKPGGGGI